MPASIEKASDDLKDLLDDELRPAIEGLESSRRSRYRIVALYAVLCLIAVVVSSLYVTFELIGGDDALLAFIPTVAFMAGVGVLITVFAYFVHVKMPLQKQFRAQILGPIVGRITPKFRDQSSAELERSEWRNSALFPDTTHQLHSDHLTAARRDELTVGFCHLKLDAGVLSYLPGSPDDQSPLPSVAAGFDGLFVVAKPAIDDETTWILRRREDADDVAHRQGSIEVDDPPLNFEAMRRVDELEPEFQQYFAVYTPERDGEPAPVFCNDIQRRLVDLCRDFEARDVDFDPIPRGALSLREGKCHVAISRPFPSPPLRPRAPGLDEETLLEFAHHLEFSFRLCQALESSSL